MKPMIIIPPGQMNQADIKLLRDNGICVVVARDPARVKFVDPIPAVAQHGKIERAAICLSRILLSGTWGSWNNYSNIGRSDFARIFVDLLTKGTELDPSGTIAEQEDKVYDYARRDEIAKMAREDARAEKAKRLAARAKAELETTTSK